MATDRQIAEAFEAAKKITALNGAECISGTKFEFICYALKHVALPGSAAATAIIMRRFVNEDGNFVGTIQSWLSYQANIVSTLLTDDNVQAYKHRWLDSVIEEFGG